MSNRFDITLDEHEALDQALEGGFLQHAGDHYTNASESSEHQIDTIQDLIEKKMLAWDDEHDTRLIITDKGEDAHDDF
jgi:hypothetical protein